MRRLSLLLLAALGWSMPAQAHGALGSFGGRSLGFHDVHNDARYVNDDGGDAIVNDADEIGLTITGNATNTADLFRVEQSDNTKVFSVDNDGDLFIGAGQFVSGVAAGAGVSFNFDDTKASGTDDIAKFGRNGTAQLTVQDDGSIIGGAGGLFACSTATCAYGRFILNSNGSKPFFRFSQELTSTIDGVVLFDHFDTSAEMNAASGHDAFMIVNPRVDQSATAGWTALEVNATVETAGSGSQFLLDLQLNDASNFSVSSTGVVLVGDNVTFDADATHDIGAAGGNRPDFIYADHANLDETLVVDGTSTLAALIFASDNAHDIGQVASARPRDIYVADDVVVGDALTVLGASSLEGTVALGSASNAISINGDTTSAGGFRIVSSASISIADTGDGNPATDTLTEFLDGELMLITCLDGNTCDVTMSETGALTGMLVTLVNVGSNIVDFADTAGVTELAGAFAMGPNDTLVLFYADNTWQEKTRSDN